jgi:hypothetical protein
MFGIELSLVQKLEIAFVCVVLGISGVFIFKSTQVPFDNAINAFTLHRVHPGLDKDNQQRTAPVTATNPKDPKRDETVVVIAVSDGKLEITKYPNDPSKHLLLVWKPDRRQPGRVYQYYKDPMLRIDRFSDSFEHALAFAVYNQVYARNLGLLRNAAMTSEQVPQEAAAREQMNKEIQLVDAAVEGGTFEPSTLEKVARAMDEYDAKPGDTTKDKEKEDLARKLLDSATTYLEMIQGAKDKCIDKYMATMGKLLSAEQKEKFVEGYKSYVASTKPSTTPGRTRGGALTPGRVTTTTAPARGATTTPARGGAATTPARGGTTTTRTGRTTTTRAAGG